MDELRSDSSRLSFFLTDQEQVKVENHETDKSGMDRRTMWRVDS